MGRIGPAQRPYGISTHFAGGTDESTAPATKPEGTEGPPAPVTGDYAELRQMETTAVEQVIDPLRLRLKDGRIVQLAGIDIPDFDPYEPGDFSLAAYNLLNKMLTGKQVRLYVTRNQKEGRINRMGYPLVHVSLSGNDPVWIQGTLLAAGLARVRPSARNPEMAAQMIALEDKARKDKVGLWTDLRYDMLTPEIAAAGLNNWALVEGQIKGVATVKNVIYLNFGDDWRRDFTIGIDSDLRRMLSKNGVDPMQLAGKTVRARGWIREYNGPYMDLLNPAWMQVLTETPAGTKTNGEKGEKQ